MKLQQITKYCYTSLGRNPQRGTFTAQKQSPCILQERKVASAQAINKKCYLKPHVNRNALQQVSRQQPSAEIFNAFAKESICGTGETLGVGNIK